MWRRIVDFPLVALVLALALFLSALRLSSLLGDMLPPMSALGVLAGRSAIAIALVLIAYKVAAPRIGERPRDDLRKTHAARDLGFGIVAGVVLICLIAAVAAAIDVYNIIGRGDLRQLPSSVIALAIFPAITEEVLFRGIIFRWLEEFFGSWAALLLTSALFGLAHILNPHATWLSAFAIALEAGLLLGGAYMLTRSLWMPIGLHAAWNFTQGFIFDVPVSGLDQHGIVEAQLSPPWILSGGSFGFEGSAIAMVVASVAGGWMAVRAVRLGRVVAPWWHRRRAADAGSF